MEFFNDILSILKTIQFRDIVDIMAISLIIFGLVRLVRETRAAQLLKGVIVLVIIYLLSSLFGLVMLSSLLRMVFESVIVIMVIIFQPEIRKALEQMGRNHNYTKIFKFLTKRGRSVEWEKSVKKSIVDAADTAVLFSRSKTGALLVFERETKLSDIASTGTIVDAETSVALFGNIFFNKAPLHDGASIIRDGKLYAAGCILPLTDNKNVDPNLGTRHRAALGMSEQSDAIILVVSEETGFISLAINGTLLRDFNREDLILKLEKFLIDDYVNEAEIEKAEKIEKHELPFVRSSKRKESEDDE
ncbi:MAG: diadenylate cyclase CdaA [Ruminococcus sp.]|nr:diadenylate cyclase CdaA [Ruminococcus sp.]